MRTKRERLDAFLEERGLSAVWFARPNTFAWLTGGNNVVSGTTEIGIAAVGYDGDRLRVVTNNIEAPRLHEEELAEEIDVEVAPWYETDLAGAVAELSSRPAAADFDVSGFESVEASGLRQPLTDTDVEAFRALGHDTAESLETVCRTLDSTDTEREVAARLLGTLADSAVTAPVVLVGGGERAQRYRHYTPTDSQLGRYVLVSVVGQRAGLCASATRTVAFDPPSWLKEHHTAATRVEASALGATQFHGRRNGTAADVFTAIQDAYAAVDHPGEWQLHHQGGAAGFDDREWIATPMLDAPVYLPMGYAWNPTIQGAKSEGTVLVTDEGFEALTMTNSWPRRTASVFESDVELERPDVLSVD